MFIGNSCNQCDKLILSAEDFANPNGANEGQWSDGTHGRDLELLSNIIIRHHILMYCSYLPKDFIAIANYRAQ